MRENFSPCSAIATRRIPAFRQGEQFESVTPQNECTSRYYLRLIVEDCPGVIASITKILADREISISRKHIRDRVID